MRSYLQKYMLNNVINTEERLLQENTRCDKQRRFDHICRE